MIRHLLIQNLILIEHAEITFDQGLTILTGETGAGKTAFTQALRLVMGDRSDASKVRKGCEKAFIQASFDLSLTDKVLEIFTDLGIALPDPDEELIISREISASGKSRAFISGQMVPLSSLQKVSPCLIDFISQHEQISLKNLENQRSLLDLFAGIDPSPFLMKWEEEKKKEKQLENLLKEAQTNPKELLAEKLGELKDLELKEDEEESLFEEYTLLSNSQEILANSAEILNLCDHVTDSCAKMQVLIKNLLKYAPKLSEGEALGKEAHLQLAELRSLVQSFCSNIETDPNRLTFLEERLKRIDKLKKKYGPNLYLEEKKLSSLLDTLEGIDHQITSLKVELDKSRVETSKEATLLTKKREAGARSLKKALSAALQRLNIPSAEISIQLDKQTRSTSGEDGISFFLRANRGEELVSVKESTSGGEISRILFALKVLLAEKSEPQTMIFDEIDANVGGETGSVMGKELRELSKKRQVLCITHFPQVARCGTHHFRVFKEEKGDRTNCRIEHLKPRERETELLRMLGGKPSREMATSAEI